MAQSSSLDNIFEAQRNRRIQNLRQQSVSNIIRQNPNLRGVLTRYEDAEVSRLKLLELQRLRSKKITKGERALLKAVAKSRGRRRGGAVGRGGKKVKVKRRIPDYSGRLAPDGTPLTTKLVEIEEFIGKDQQIGEGGSTDPIDPELERDKLRLEQDKLKQQRDIARQERIQRGELAARERGQRQIQFEQQQRLEDRRLDIQRARDAERAITDREREQTLQASFDALRRERQKIFQDIPLGSGLVASIDTSTSLTGAGQVLDIEDTTLQEQQQPQPEPEPEPKNLRSQPVSSQPSIQRRETINPRILRGDPEPKKRFQIDVGATEAQIRSELGSTSTQSSVREEETAPTPINRTGFAPEGRGQIETLSQEKTLREKTDIEKKSRPKLKPGEVIVAPVQPKLFQSPAGQELQKQIQETELSLKELQEKDIEKIDL